MYFEKFDEYIERLLQVQYVASDIIKHNLTKGEVREEFLKDEVKKQFHHVCYHKGFIVSDSGFQSGQLDVIVTLVGARKRPFGSHTMVNIEDAKMVLEVKSCATKKDVEELEEKAKSIKEQKHGENVQVGLFCYTYDVKKRTFLSRFGYNYDKELDEFNFNTQHENQFRNIDFIISIDDDKDLGKGSFFLTKDVIENNFILNLDEPVSKYFFRKFETI